MWGSKETPMDKEPSPQSFIQAMHAFGACFKRPDREAPMDNRPNYRMVEVSCCAACQHIRYTHEDEPLCVHGLPPAEAEGLGAWRPGSKAATVDPFGVCDAYEIENNA